jgi:Protein of unknown function (DUF1453)
LLQYLIPFVIVVMLGLRARRLTRVRPLKIEWLWVVPAIYLVLVTFLFVKGPPSPVGWLVCVAMFGLGCAIGWQRGKTMRIEVDPETHTLSQKGSMVAVFILLGLFAVRFASEAEAQILHLDFANLVTDALAALALGVFTLTRVEMYIRAKALLEAARA